MKPWDIIMNFIQDVSKNPNSWEVQRTTSKKIKVNINTQRRYHHSQKKQSKENIVSLFVHQSLSAKNHNFNSSYKFELHDTLTLWGLWKGNMLYHECYNKSVYYIKSTNSTSNEMLTNAKVSQLHMSSLLNSTRIFPSSFISTACKQFATNPV